jgi:O-antigen/teichoic acid export membrane protein
VSGILQSFKHTVEAELLSNILRPLTLLAMIVALWKFQRAALTTPEVLWLYLLATVLALGASALYTRIVAPDALHHVRGELSPRLWLRTAGGFMLVMLASAVSERIDILAIGWSASRPEIAAYAVAARFGQTVIAAGAAVMAVAAPHIMECLGDLDGKRERVRALIHQAAVLYAGLTVSALAVFAALGPLLLHLFGPHYTTAYAPLMILLAGLVAASALGPAAIVATFVGETQVAVLGLVLGAILNAGLNLLLVPSFGAIGAACATAAGNITAAIVAWQGLKRRTGLDTSLAEFWRLRKTSVAR